MERASSTNSDIQDFVNDCRSLYKISRSSTKKLLYNSVNGNFKSEILIEMLEEVKSVNNLYEQMVQSNLEIREKVYSSYQYTIQNYHYEVWMKKLYYEYDSLLYSIKHFLEKLLKLYSKECLEAAIRLISFYNKLILLNISVNVDIKYAHSISSLLLQNRRKFTLNKVLKILARNRTEECAHNLISYLLRQFQDTNKIQTPTDYTDIEEEDLINTDNNMHPESDKTSILVYKTLTQYVSPPPSVLWEAPNISTVKVSVDDQQQSTTIMSFVITERQRLNDWFTALTMEPTELLSEDEIKFSNISGHLKLRSLTILKMAETYEKFLWQYVGIVNEHMLLWWLYDGLGRKSQTTSVKFNAWLKQYYATENLNMVMQPIIRSLIDCLCCYITSTSWNELFTQALISAGHPHARHELQDTGLGTKTGHLFSDLLYNIVFLTNSCEGSNWTAHDLENLPLAEQIPLLHRLDHSIHTVRLWALSRAKYLANSWNIEQFFRVTHVDVNASLYALSQLKLAENIQFKEEKPNSHFTVYSKMRAKLICEININTVNLQDVPKRSLSIFACVCRITSLAYLRICFPGKNHWQQYENQPKDASNYVEQYLDEIVKPVLLASQNLPLPVQKSVSKLVLEIACEAWLDHIYKYRIKFSECGALQLLIDFGATSCWITEKVLVSDDIRQFLRSIEILRICEGVGRLLLRQPGETIIMNTEGNILIEGIDSKEIENVKTLMPPEMYVPNQEKWLELRLSQKKGPLTTCC